MHRILDFSQTPIRLRTRLKQLVVQPENAPHQTIPFEDIEVVLVAHPQITLSQAVLEEIAESGAVLIACNRKSLPIGMFVPLAAHHLPHQRLELQINAPLPQRKRIWRQIVKAKIKAQGQVLQSLFGTDYGLMKMSQNVKSDDHENLEAHAARKYWSKLFVNFEQDQKFRRNQDGEDSINLRLNYGYGVLRGIIARSICAVGLQPTIGLHHHNQYNAYCLADDLMEPFRPLVDKIVYEQVSQPNVEPTLTPKTKAALIKPLLGRFLVNGELQTIFEAATHTSSSLVQVFAKERDNLLLPDSFEVVEEEKPF
jgi:CRISPR-associated protein Cas1